MAGVPAQHCFHKFVPKFALAMEKDKKEQDLPVYGPKRPIRGDKNKPQRHSTEAAAAAKTNSKKQAEAAAAAAAPAMAAAAAKTNSKKQAEAAAATGDDCTLYQFWKDEVLGKKRRFK